MPYIETVKAHFCILSQEVLANDSDSCFFDVIVTIAGQQNVIPHSTIQNNVRSQVVI